MTQHTYSLREVAAQVLPPEWVDAERWLARRLNRGEINGYRVGRTWRLTQTQIDELIDTYTNNTPQPEPLTVADGLSARSRRRLRSA